MVQISRLLAPALAVSTLSLVACSDDEGSSAPEGTHYTFVSSEASVPTNNMQARDFGLDLNGDKTVDNQLGMVLSTLQGQGFDVQGAITQAVLQGDIILMVDVQTKSFTSTSGAGLAIKLGAMPMPAACTDPTMIATCGQHLKGTGTFTIAAGSPDNAAVAGKIVGGVFTGGPGKISLQIALGAGPVQLDLIGARAKATGITEAGIDSVILAGALTKEDLDGKVIPAIAMQIAPLITRDCNMPTMPPGCGCAVGSTGKTVLSLFDTALPKDCMVTVDEIKTNSLIMALLSPDVKIDGKDALSLGIKVKATKGTLR
jgi:hypothetical protein